MSQLQQRLVNVIHEHKQDTDLLLVWFILVKLGMECMPY